MKTMSARFKIVTPMFLGDANQESTEVRSPSIKGALRFWWRALRWTDIRRCIPNDAKALRALHQKEKTLFGGEASYNSKGVPEYGQGCFLLSVENEENLNAEPPLRSREFNPGNGHQYLLGQGLWHFRDRLMRHPLAQRQFTLKVLFKPNTDSEHQKEIARAVLLFGLLGGLGSRMRRGFGSVSISEWNIKEILPDFEYSIPNNVSEYIDTLEKLFADLPVELPPFTAFSKRTRVDISKTGRDALSLLNEVGEELQLYRSYGKDGKVNGQKAERNFHCDHDNAEAAAEGRMIQEIPKRTVFGLPHNYFFSSTKKKLDIDASNTERARRGSPLFIHIHEFSDNDYIAVQSLFEAQFLPECDRVKIGDRRRPQELPAVVDWSVITEYLDRFPERKQAQL